MAKIPKSCLASEQQELEALIAWARLKKIPLLHHAGERKCTPREGAKFSRSGVISGFPDLSLYQARGGYGALFLELKCNRHYSPSEMKTKTWMAQQEWLTRLRNENYHAVMAYGWDQAREIVETYLSWPRIHIVGHLLCH